MKWVIDCSVVAALVLPDEDSELARAFLAGLGAGDSLVAPGLLWLELGNVMASALRRGRISHAQAQHALHLAYRLDIEIDARGGIHEAIDCLELSALYGLSAYDAAYLELALREAAGLATADKALIQAAKAAGVMLGR
jgi:predicted nucleic acid-binding protein